MSHKRKISSKLYWLLHPLALAFYVFLILLYFIPDFFNKYTADVVSSKLMGNGSIMICRDLDHDDNEEIIYCGYNAGFVASFHLKNHKNKLLGQWNFRGNWLEKHEELIGDYNDNLSDEIYCLTIDSDSLFLNIIEPLSPNTDLLINQFICTVGLFEGDRVHVDYVGAKLIDVNKDGYKDYVFVLYAGYSKFPRKVFVYDIKNDVLESSPLSAAGITTNIYFFDLNDDGVDEICGRVAAHENIHYQMPYTDSCSWLMVLNLKPQPSFLFPPIEYKSDIGSEIRTVPYEINNIKYLASVFISQSSKIDHEFFSLKVFNEKGILINEKAISYEEFEYLSFINFQNNDTKYFYLTDKKGDIYRTNTKLQLELYHRQNENTEFQNDNNPVFIDIDDDDRNEMILAGRVNDVSIMIYDDELKSPVILDLPSLNNSYHFRYSKKTPTEDNPANMVISSSNSIVQISYQRNPFFYFKYPFYISVYIFLLLIFWLLQKAQNYIAQRNFETEKQLMQQQLALSKKQIEPHFMLNTINNIGYLFMKEDKQKAMFYLGKFAALMRRGLMNADKTSTSLEEEMEFVKDYLSLQKQLLDDELDYQIKVDKGIEDDKIQIPHSLIYTFVENAIKHGLRPKEKDRKINIDITKDQGRVKIFIQDNGIGRLKSKELKTTDTGQGMLIIKNIIEGYNKLHGGNISYQVEDVLEDSGVVSGTLVEIWV